MGKVRFGLSNVHYAVYDSATSKYGTPVKFPGAVNLSLDAEGDTSTFYADNGAYYTTSTNAGYSLTLEMAAADDQVYIDLLGWEKDDSGVLFEAADATPADFALLYEVNGDPSKQRGVLYSVKLSRPSSEHATTEDSAEPSTVSFEGNAIGRNFDIKGETRSVIKGSVEQGQDGYATFMNAVHTPTVAGA